MVSRSHPRFSSSASTGLPPAGWVFLNHDMFIYMIFSTVCFLLIRSRKKSELIPFLHLFSFALKIPIEGKLIKILIIYLFKSWEKEACDMLLKEVNNFSGKNCLHFRFVKIESDTTLIISNFVL